MANTYTQFSFAVPLDNEDQIAWARRAVAYLHDHAEDAPWAEGDELAVVLPDDDWVGFAADVDDDGLWIYAEETGQPEHVVPLVQEFLRRFRPDGFVGFEWADHSSKPLIDGFGGGACLVSPDTVRWLSTSKWLSELVG